MMAHEFVEVILYNAPINVSLIPLPDIGGDLYNLLFKGHTPGAIIFYNAPL